MCKTFTARIFYTDDNIFFSDICWNEFQLEEYGPEFFEGTPSTMGPHWPEHYFCQFEKRLLQPKIKSTRWIHLEIHFNPA